MRLGGWLFALLLLRGKESATKPYTSASSTIQGVSYVSERFQEAIRRLWGHNTKNLFNKFKLIRFTRLQRTCFFSINPPLASTTASNLLWALAQQLRIVFSSRSAHTFLRLLLRLSTLAWVFSQAFLAKIPHMKKSITMRSGEDGGRKHSGQNRWKLSWHHCWTILAQMFLASILTWPQCYGLCHVGNFDNEGLWKTPC